MNGDYWGSSCVSSYLEKAIAKTPKQREHL